MKSRPEREKLLELKLEEILGRGGSCLIPVFALGRAQELMLLIEQMWKSNSKFGKIKVYFASELGKKALRVYQTFPNSMNDNIQKVMDFKVIFSFLT